MVNRLFKSLDVLLRDKQSLTAKTSQLQQTERRLVQNLSRALAGAGYRVVPLSGRTPQTRRAVGRPATRSAKRLRCPECDRTFAHPLPMARHVKATHHPDKPKKTGKKRGRRKSA